jgi:WW domain
VLRVIKARLTVRTLRFKKDLTTRMLEEAVSFKCIPFCLIAVVISSNSLSSIDVAPSTGGFQQGGGYGQQAQYGYQNPGAYNQGYGQGYGQSYQAPVATYGQPQAGYGQVSYSAPPPVAALPTSEWKSAHSPDGQIYYYNERTGQTQWDKPVGMP